LIWAEHLDGTYHCAGATHRLTFLGFELGESNCETLVHNFIIFDAFVLPGSDGEADLERRIVVQLEGGPCGKAWAVGLLVDADTGFCSGPLSLCVSPKGDGHVRRSIPIAIVLLSVLTPGQAVGTAQPSNRGRTLDVFWERGGSSV
jgi:hypothetical protein